MAAARARGVRLGDRNGASPPRPARLSAAVLREGATLDEMVAAIGWRAHTVRGAMAGALKRRLGLAIVSEKEARGRVYRIAG